MNVQTLKIHSKIHCSPIWNVSLVHVAIILSLLIVFPLEFKEGSHGSSEVTSNSSESTDLNSPDGPSSMGEGKMEKDFQQAINYYSKVKSLSLIVILMKGSNMSCVVYGTCKFV